MTRNVKHFLEIKKETSTPFELELCGNKPISYIYTNRKRRISQDINCKE